MGTAPPDPLSSASKHGTRLLELVLLLATTLVCLPLLSTPGYEGDIQRLKYWSRRVTLDGLATAYATTGTFDVDYPPVTLYLLKIVGTAYRALADPGFDWDRAFASRAFTAGIKSIGVAFHLLGASIVLRMVARDAGVTAAYAASAAYAFNPAILYDVAHWGQPDTLHSFLLVLGVVSLAAGRPVASGLAVGLALMTKPQAWALLPVFVGISILARAPSPGRFLAGCGAGVLLPVLPFLASGTWDQLLDLPPRIMGGMPYVNAGAHNLWWLVTGGTNWDRLRADGGLWGTVTYRQVAAALVLAATAFALYAARRRPRQGIAASAAYCAFAWYVLTVQAHENHSFFVLPLLAITLHQGSWPRIAFAVVTVTLLVNLFLHSPEIWGRGLEDFAHLDGVRLRLSLANAATNLLLFASWTAALTRGSISSPGRVTA